MRTKVILYFLTILIVGNIFGCGESSTSTESATTKKNTITNDKEDSKSNEEEVYSFVSLDSKSYFGASFNKTYVEAIEEINNKNLYSKEIIIDNLSKIVPQDTSSNILGYLYEESEQEGMVIAIDIFSNKVVYGNIVVNLDYVDKNNISDIYKKAASLFEILVSESSDSIDSDFFVDWMSSYINAPIIEGNKVLTVSYKNGLAFQFIVDEYNMLTLRLYAFEQEKYDKWEEEQWVNLDEIKSKKLVQLKEFDVINNMQEDKLIHNDYRVAFDGEYFNMDVLGKSTYCPYQSWSNGDWMDENIILYYSLNNNNDAIELNLEIYAANNYHFIVPSLESDMYKFVITFQCTTNKMYKYDLETNTELRDFIASTINKLKELHPLPEERRAKNVDDMSQYEWLLYCADLQEPITDGYRVSIGEHIYRFAVRSSSGGELLKYWYTRDYKNILTQKDVVVLKDIDTWQQISIVKLGDEDDEVIKTIYTLELELECLSDPYNNQLSTEYPEEFLKVLEAIADALAED